MQDWLQKVFLILVGDLVHHVAQQDHSVDIAHVAEQFYNGEEKQDAGALCRGVICYVFPDDVAKLVQRAEEQHETKHYQVQQFQSFVRFQEQLLFDLFKNSVCTVPANGENVEAHDDCEYLQSICTHIVSSFLHRVVCFVEKVGNDEGYDDNVEGVEALTTR